MHSNVAARLWLPKLRNSEKDLTVYLRAWVRRFYERKAARTNKIVAIKATAHKLARAAYHVMRERVPFDEARAFG